jgi:hypothetical protein
LQAARMRTNTTDRVIRFTGSRRGPARRSSTPHRMPAWNGRVDHRLAGGSEPIAARLRRCGRAGRCGAGLGGRGGRRGELRVVGVRDDDGETPRLGGYWPEVSCCVGALVVYEDATTATGVRRCDVEPFAVGTPDGGGVSSVRVDLVGHFCGLDVNGDDLGRDAERCCSVGLGGNREVGAVG